MAENGTSSPAAATVAVAEKKVEDKRSWADEEETALPPPPTATGSSSGVEAETAELKKIEELTISEEKETTSRLIDPDKSEIKAVRKFLSSS